MLEVKQISKQNKEPPHGSGWPICEKGISQNDSRKMLQGKK